MSSGMASAPTHHDWIAVISYGGSSNHLVARQIRACQVYCEVWPHTALREVLARQPKGIVLCGGEASGSDEGAAPVDPTLFDVGVPVLGIGHGLHAMVEALGGRVVAGSEPGYGRARLTLLKRDHLFAALEDEAGGGIVVWMSYAHLIDELPPGFEATAKTDIAPIAAVRHSEARLFGVQFHPEVTHTTQGREILRNFVVDVCGCQPTWTMESFVDSAVANIRQTVGTEKVLAALSGGVDSAVAAALMERAIGDQLTCVFVDHGFMRQGEPEQVEETFATRMGDNFIRVDASERFLSKLEGVADPEAKRKIIGAEFIRVFEEEARGLGEVRFLVQGTLYSDVIESGVGESAGIKSHHNVGGLPDRMHFELIEPLRQLFKDEVRELGLVLGLPPAIVWRQPFPGPGLAIRICGAIDAQRVNVVRQADRIVCDEIQQAGLARDIWQYFAVLTDTRSVGVSSDARTYGYVVAIRAVTSQDAMTADWGRLPYDLLDRMAQRIMNEVGHVSRVVYDISSKPPATIEWE